MIYVCDRCLFSFKRVNPPDLCPDCGSTNLREATLEERAAFEEKQLKKTEQK